jgi:hypothetical protein
MCVTVVSHLQSKEVLDSPRAHCLCRIIPVLGGCGARGDGDRLHEAEVVIIGVPEELRCESGVTGV